jgi:branched-chain amino acid transport system ATP-binding protein
MSAIQRTTALRLVDLHVSYGQVKSVTGVTFTVDEGSIVAVIGSNGAGKSTLLKAISGLITPESGSIEFRGKSIVNMAPHAIAKLKMIHVPEGRGILTEMSVKENLEMGAYLESNRKKIRQRMKEVCNLFPILDKRLKQKSGTLSGGEQQMLAIARAIMAGPELLMLDEPSLGLAPLVIRDVFNTIRKINREGNTILLMEQSANLALNVAEHAFILENGKVVLSGSTDDLINNEQVRKIYIGED